LNALQKHRPNGRCLNTGFAAKRGNAGIAIGNIVGSNIFNILFVIGTAALICPVPFETFSSVSHSFECTSKAPAKWSVPKYWFHQKWFILYHT